jgi:hypothetical protein
MSEVNEGVQIILNRMESNPEEFFGEGGKWNWMFKETLREVMSEQEKAALHAGLVKVRRLEITAKAVATVMPKDEEEEENKGYAYTAAIPKPEGKKMVINRAQAEMIKRLAGENYK